MGRSSTIIGYSQRSSFVEKLYYHVCTAREGLRTKNYELYNQLKLKLFISRIEYELHEASSNYIALVNVETL